MRIPKVEIGVEVGLSDEFHALRSDVLASNGSETRDQFDHSSLNIFARVDGAAAGSLRLDLQGLRVLRAWSLDGFEEDDQPGDCSISRAVVTATHRGLGLYRAMVERAVEEARRAEAIRMQAVVYPAFPLLPYLESLGFTKDQKLRRFDNPPQGSVLACVLTLVFR